MTLETELRDRLHHTAWQVRPTGDDLAAADTVISRRKVERRQRAVALAVGVCVVLLVVLVPILSEYKPNRAAPATSTRGAPQWTEPTRGSLAHDRAFLDAIRARGWPHAPEGPPPVASRSVVFAGDAAGSRWVLVAGVAKGQLAGQWFTGPAGAPAAALEPGWYTGTLRQDAPVANLRADASGVGLVLLTRPGDRVEVSWRVTVDSDGQLRRSYEPMSVTDGVASGHASSAPAVRFRVLRDGVRADGGSLGGAWSPPPGMDVVADQSPRRPGGAPASARAVRQAMEEVLQPTGLAPADVQPTVLWTGTAALPGNQSTPVVMLALTMPSGAVVVSTAYGADDPALAGGACGAGANPAGTALDSLVVATECDLPSGTGVQHTLVVSAPAGYDHLRFESATGKILTEEQLVRGAAILPDPGTVATAVVSGPGRADLRVPLVNSGPSLFDVD